MRAEQIDIKPAGPFQCAMSLDQDQFLNVVAATPLVSIDLVLHSERGRVLLGKRLNRPAQGFWFVPGGRIRKNERLQDALRRISQAELGILIERAELIGAFDHVYEDNFYGAPGINTHYVALAHRYLLSEQTPLQGDDQHAAMRWWSVPELLASPEVHENTKRYFS